MQRLALVGANGMLARKVRELTPSGYELIEFDLPDFDITDGDGVLTALARCRPAVIVNCAAYTDVDGAETDESLAMRVNGLGPGQLARAARELGATLIHISTDYVFDGGKPTPYGEDDPVAPMSVYGRSKLAGEEAIRASALTAYYIVRTSWLYGPGGKNFVETVIRLAAEREELRIVDDQIGSPTYTGDLAAALFALLDAGESRAPFGVYHFANEGETSWCGFACEIIALMKHLGMTVAARRVVPIATHDYPLPARRPAYSVFAKDKFRRATGMTIPAWRDSLAAYMRARID